MKGDEERADHMRRELGIYVKTKEMEILNQDNEIADKQDDLEKAQSNAARLQNRVDSSILNSSDKTLELGQVLASIANMEQRAASMSKKQSSSAPPPPNAQTTESHDQIQERVSRQLDAIGTFVIDYQEIIREYEDSLEQLENDDF